MKLQTIGWFLVSIIVIGAGFYIYNDIYSKSAQEIAQNEEIYLENELNLEKGEQNGIIITPIKNENTINIPVPDLNKPIIFGDNVSDKEKELAVLKIDKLTEELKKDNNFFSNWIELGLYRKLIGDYEGAVEVLEYVNLMWPKNDISFNNLGDLYGYYLNNQQKAEKNFLKAIENSPNTIGYYLKMMEFYLDVVKNTGKARQIIERGIQSNSASEELKSFLKNPNLQ